jgi:aspartate aminotransferase-like enzyme
MTAHSGANPLRHIEPYPAQRYAPLADRLGGLLGTVNDVVLVQGEAIIALEAAATGLGAPGVRALNIVTSPYGRLFGDWLARGGAEVRTLTAAAGLPIDADEVRAAFAAGDTPDLVALVHGEAASGILNPLEEIAAIARRAGALVVVDAVASVGGHPLDVDELGADVVVIGPQKALGGPASLSAASVSPRAWEAFERNATGIPSVLSLLDIKRGWIDTGRGALPGTPDPLSFWALEAAVAAVEDEGMPALIRRHARAAAATRAGVRALGVTPWMTDDARALNLVTTVPVPDGVTAASLLARARELDPSVTPGVGAVADRILRLNHTADRAAFSPVLATVVAYGEALAGSGIGVDIGSAAAAVSERYARG